VGFLGRIRYIGPESRPSIYPNFIAGSNAISSAANLPVVRPGILLEAVLPVALPGILPAEVVPLVVLPGILPAARVAPPGILLRVRPVAALPGILLLGIQT
jgi:hypothetical protein